MNAYAFLVGLAIFSMGAVFPLAAQRYTIEKIGLEQGMPSARVNDILEDQRGFMWIATEGAGLLRFDGHEFQQVDPGVPSLQPIATALAEDSLGRIWFAMENELLSYDGLHFNRHFFPVNPGRIIKIVFDDQQRPLVASRNAVFWLETISDTLTPASPRSFDRINDLRWHQGKAWLATSGGLMAGEETVAPGSWNSLALCKGQLIAQANHEVWSTDSSINNDFRGRFLACRGELLAGLQRDSLILRNARGTARIGEDNGLPAEEYKGCYIDRSGVVWLYSNSGLFKLPDTGYKLFDNLGGEAFAVLRHNKELLAGTSKGLVQVAGGSRIRIPANFPYGVVLAISYFEGTYWLGTESGLVSYDGSGYRLVPLEGSGGDFVFALHSDADRLWIGAGSGIFSLSNGRIRKAVLPESELMPSVYAISEASDGSLWFATYTQGLFRRFNGEWSNIRELGGLSLDSLRFSSFSAVSAEELYLGTLSEGVFHVFSSGYDHLRPEQMAYAEVRALRVIDASRLWMSTNKGIYQLIHQQNFEIEHLQPSQELMEEGGISQALYADDEILLAGTEQGMLLIDIPEVKRQRDNPDLAITAIELFYGQIGGLEEYAKGISPYTHLPENLKLPYNLNFLSFRLAGLTGYEPQNLIYRYRINRDQEWTLAGNRREAVFSNLRPGIYEFQAQVTRPGEDWGDEVLRYSFSIKPPVWQQWWFILISIVLIVGLSYWYFRNRLQRISQRLRLENELMEMERKALRLQMNPHFIFNALDSISSFIFKNDVQQAVRYLNNFAKLMRLTLESSMEHLHPVESEVSILKNYLELEKLRFQGKLDYEIDVSDEIDYDVGIPPMLIQPHVENAILHGIKPKEGSGKVSIRFYLDEELLVCEVEDDGIGRARSREIEKRRDHRSMATEINHDRLQLLKRSLGDKVGIEIIDKAEDSGTMVRISLPAEQY